MNIVLKHKGNHILHIQKTEEFPAYLVSHPKHTDRSDLEK